MCSKNTVHTVAFVLVIIGGINWLLVAFGMNLVEMILGSFPQVVKLTYILVGLSALYLAVSCRKNCSCCGTGA